MWICQSLYAATIWDVELKDWEYEPIFTKDVNSNTIEIKLQQVPPEDLCEDIRDHPAETGQSGNEAKQKETNREKDEKPSFGNRPDTKSSQFNFKEELERLPFELNIGEAPLTRKQQAHLIDIIYDHTDIFSLFDVDLGFCDAQYPHHNRSASLSTSSPNTGSAPIRSKEMLGQLA